MLLRHLHHVSRDAPLILLLSDQVLVERVLFLSNRIYTVEVVQVLDLKCTAPVQRASLSLLWNLPRLVIVACKGDALTVMILLPSSRLRWLRSFLMTIAEVTEVGDLVMVQLALIQLVVDVGAGRVRERGCLQLRMAAVLQSLLM